MNEELLIKIYMDRFINQATAWGKQLVSRDGDRCGYAHQKPDMDTKGGKYRFEPVTPDLVLRHFIGKVTCAWAAVDEALSSKWICFDSDTADGELDRLENFLRQHRWLVIREGRRQGRDGHLWLLFDAPVSASTLIVLGDAMLNLAGVRHLERFPKYADGYSQVRGPLGVNKKPEAQGARGLFDGVEATLKSQLQWLAAQPLNRLEDAIREAERHKPSPKIQRTNCHRQPLRKSWSNFQILNFVDARQVGKEWVAQCPLCQLEGHDRHEDNLKIWNGGSAFCCVFQGPSQIHKNRDIIAALVWGKRDVC